MRSGYKHLKLFLAALLVLLGGGSPVCANLAELSPAVVALPKTPDSAVVDQEGLSEKLLEASGIKKQLLGMDASGVVDKLQLAFLGLPPEETTIVSNIYSRVFRPEVYYKSVLGTFAKGVNRAHLSTVSQWFLTPQGKKVVQLESIAQSMNGYQKEEKTTALISSKFPSEERVALIGRLEKAMGSTQLAITLTQLQLQHLLPLGAELKTEGAANLLAKLKEKRGTQPLHERTLLSLLYTYRDLSDQDLASLAGFAESVHGQWFFQLKQKALTEAQNQMGDIVAGQIATLLKTIKSGTGDKQTIREVLPVGTRYLFAQGRDPFSPDSQSKKEFAKINFSRVLLENTQRAERLNAPKPPRFGAELKVLNAIPLEIYSRLKEKKQALYDGLERYGVLFKEQNDLLAMNDEVYRGAVEEYKRLIDKANSMGKEIIMSAPLQIPYDSLTPAGVIWKNKEPLVLVETSNKLGYPARKGTLIGPEYGVIESIDQNKIVVVERKRDFKGNILSKKKELNFNVNKKTNEVQP